MKLKAFIALLACTCLLLPLCACNGSDEASGSGAGASSAAESGYIYKSDSVEVVPLKCDEQTYYALIDGIAIDPTQAFTRAAALSGTVSNIREAKVLYKSDGEDKEGQITLFDLTVKDATFGNRRAYISYPPKMPQELSDWFRPFHKTSHIYKLYLHYCYLLGYLPKHTDYKPTSPYLKEDLQNAENQNFKSIAFV